MALTAISRRTVGVAAVLLFLAAVTAVQSQPALKPFVPQVGQQGKDVIWVPTPEELLERMLKMAKVGPNDFVMDLGSGDGRIAIAAAKKFGARAQGIEYNADMVDVSNASARRQGVADRVKFIKADIFQTDFSQASVITMYLLPDLNLKLRPKILDMKPGTRVASHQFSMGDWEADEQDMIDARAAYLWIVPAKVGGNWKLLIGAKPVDLALTQTFQVISGNAKGAAFSGSVRAGKLKGEAIAFSIVNGGGATYELSGRVRGNAMEGTANGPDGEAKWTATRQERP